MASKRVVAITGCDSGLGWALAARTAREGLVTVAGMFDGTDTEAANALKKLCAHPCQLDVRKQESVTEFREFVQELLRKNPDYKLHAVINNAGVMTVGDFEWQTPSMMEEVVNVNLLGCMRVTSAFLPDLRRTAAQDKFPSKPRIINIASHCGVQPLPGFSVYGATKAGLLAWTKSMRLELREYRVHAVVFVPGGFPVTSNILSRQKDQGQSMLHHLDDEQNNLYSKRISALTDLLSSVAPQNVEYDLVKDEEIIESFMKALLSGTPGFLYKVEPWRYRFYYGLLKLPLPEAVHLWLAKRFLGFPE